MTAASHKSKKKKTKLDFHVSMIIQNPFLLSSFYLLNEISPCYLTVLWTVKVKEYVVEINTLKNK